MSNILAPILSHPFLVVAGCVLFAVASQVYGSRTAGLNDIPGPWLAKYTNLWRLLETKKTGGDADYMHEMHKKYGDVVRVGPHAVNVADPANIPAIYGNKARLHKVL